MYHIALKSNSACSCSTKATIFLLVVSRSNWISFCITSQIERKRRQRKTIHPRKHLQWVNIFSFHFLSLLLIFFFISTASEAKNCFTNFLPYLTASSSLPSSSTTTTTTASSAHLESEDRRVFETEGNSFSLHYIYLLFFHSLVKSFAWREDFHSIHRV